MTDPKTREKRINKQFILNNSKQIKEYALEHQQNLGSGVIVINLLLVENNILRPEDLQYRVLDSKGEVALNYPLSYIPESNFWFKMIRLKIRKTYQIDIKTDYDLNQKLLLIFIKDSSLEKFSIYSIKVYKN